MTVVVRTFYGVKGRGDGNPFFSAKVIWSIFLIVLSFFCCRNPDSVTIDFCEMLNEDQFHSSGEARKQGLAEIGDAKKVFKKNFDQVLELTKRQGFPRVSREGPPQDSCTYWAIAATFIHTAKSNPEVFFEKNTVSLMKEEMNKENLDREFLILACNISFQTVTFCNELQISIKNALDTWGLSAKMYDKAKFTQCN